MPPNDPPTAVEDQAYPFTPEAIEVRVVNPQTERDDCGDFSSTSTFVVLGSGAVNGPSVPVQILGRNGKRKEAVITVYDASGNGAGVYLCSLKQAQSGQSDQGCFVPSGVAVPWKGKNQLFVAPATVKSNAGICYVGVIDQHYE